MKNQTKGYIFIVLNILTILLLVFIFIKPDISELIKYSSLILPLLNIIGWYLLIKAEDNHLNKEEQLIKKINNLESAFEQQNIHIRNQQDEIYKQMDSIKEQKSIIEYQKQELEDSINYAFRIQQAILPPTNYINSILKDYFIFYLPKSIVSGDFYFVEQEKDYIIIAAVDCTGHGVPGAMMSVIGYDLLNQAVKINHMTKPSNILSFVDEGVTHFLRQINDESGVHDGMDISIISIYKQLNLVEFAGAYHELYFTHKNNIFEIKGDKLPIGMNVDGVVDQYTNHGVQVSKGDMLYIFSDGYADQFGGKDNKKFKYKALKELLLDIHTQDTIDQKQILANALKDWQGSNEQVDDILIIGIRI